MFVAVYWWRVHPGKEEQFVRAWTRGTELIREDGVNGGDSAEASTSLTSPAPATGTSFMFTAFTAFTATCVFETLAKNLPNDPLPFPFPLPLPP